MLKLDWAYCPDRAQSRSTSALQSFSSTGTGPSLLPLQLGLHVHGGVTVSAGENTLAPEMVHT